MKLWLLTCFVLGTAANAHAMAPREIYQKSGAAVVLILGSDDGRSGNGGTGSIISKDGQVVTNGHVVLNAQGVPYKQIYVYLKPAKISGDNSVDLKQRYTAVVKGYSPASELDLALLQIEGPPGDLPTVQFGDPDDVNIGDPVVAVGHPEQGGLWTLTTGTISTVIQNFDRIKGKHVFQTEASFNRGNSGGPLFDEYGNMVGINTMIARKAPDGLAITAVNFSLKSSVAVGWLKSKQVAVAYAPRPAGGQAQGQQYAMADTAPSKRAAASGGSAAPAAPPPAAPAAPAPAAAAPAAASPPSVSVAPAAPVPPPAGTPKDVPKTTKFETEKKPFNMDNLLRDQMKELEDMMGDMRGKTGKKLGGKKGMGL